MKCPNCNQEANAIHNHGGCFYNQQAPMPAKSDIVLTPRERQPEIWNAAFAIQFIMNENATGSGCRFYPESIANSAVEAFEATKNKPTK